MSPAFPVRQLADIALKGLSPGVNDPTTAADAMDALAAVLVRAAGAALGREVPTRADADGVRAGTPASGGRAAAEVRRSTR